MELILHKPQESILDEIASWVRKTFAHEPARIKVLNADPICDQEDVPDYVQFECGAELGGIIAVGMIKPSVELGDNDTEMIQNLEDDGFWASIMGASPSTGWIIKKTRGSLPAGTPTEEDGWGLVVTERTGDDREVTFEARGVMKNKDFVAAINKSKDGWGFVYVTAGKDENGYNAFYAPNVSIYMSQVIDQSIKTQMRWSGSAKWSTDMTPSLPFIAPASIFI